MKIPFKYYKNKNIMVVTDKELTDFVIDTLQFAKNNVSKNLNENYGLKDIKEYLLYGVLRCFEKIKVFKSDYFTCDTECGKFFWSVTTEKDGILLSSYLLNTDTDEITPYIAYKISEIEEYSCRTYIYLFNSIDIIMDSETQEISTLLKLLLFIVKLVQIQQSKGEL